MSDELRRAAQNVLAWMSDPQMSQWRYVESSDMYCDMSDHINALRAALAHDPGPADEPVGEQWRSDADHPIEVWHGERKVTIYPDSVLRSWGINIDTEMSDEPINLSAIQRAMDWLYAPAAPKADPTKCDDCDERERLRDQMSKLLTGVANALRGDPGPLHRWSWHDLPERAAAAVVAIGVMQKAAIASAAAPAPAVPNGWKLVPVNPTSDMIVAADTAWFTWRMDKVTWQDIYRAMLAAAPQPTEPREHDGPGGVVTGGGM